MTGGRDIFNVASTRSRVIRQSFSYACVGNASSLSPVINLSIHFYLPRSFLPPPPLLFFLTPRSIFSSTLLSVPADVRASTSILGLALICSPLRPSTSKQLIPPLSSTFKPQSNLLLLPLNLQGRERRRRNPHELGDVTWYQTGRLHRNLLYKRNSRSTGI